MYVLALGIYNEITYCTNKYDSGSKMCGINRPKSAGE
jgi:hypothetical protein